VAADLVRITFHDAGEQPDLSCSPGPGKIPPDRRRERQIRRSSAAVFFAPKPFPLVVDELVDHFGQGAPVGPADSAIFRATTRATMSVESRSSLSHCIFRFLRCRTSARTGPHCNPGREDLLLRPEGLLQPADGALVVGPFAAASPSASVPRPSPCTRSTPCELSGSTRASEPSVFFPPPPQEAASTSAHKAGRGAGRASGWPGCTGAAPTSRLQDETSLASDLGPVG